MDRVKHLLPIRFSRMLESPFAFFRGTAVIQAHDLKNTASADIIVQSCGDCHLANFGIFASPERTLIFDINDFDETLPAPFEWDIKRLASSFVLSSRWRNFGKKEGYRTSRSLRGPGAERLRCVSCCRPRRPFPYGDVFIRDRDAIPIGSTKGSRRCPAEAFC
jgi:hypothetical protein